MSYRSRRYYNNRNSSWLLEGLLWLFVILLIWAIAKFKNWIQQLTESEKYLYGRLTILGLLILIVLIWFIRKKRQSNYDEIYSSDNFINTQKSTDNKQQIVSENNHEIKDDFWLIQKLREISSKDFEDIIAKIFEMKGYVIFDRSKWKRFFWRRIPKRDGGIDLTVTKDNHKIYIQIKHYQTHQLGVPVVNGFYWVIVDRLSNNDKWIIITTSIFSKDAKEFAKNKNIEMIDYQILLQEIYSLDENKKAELMSLLSRLSIDNKFGKYAKTCPKCLAPLHETKQWFYGCMNYYETWCTYKESI